MCEWPIADKVDKWPVADKVDNRQGRYELRTKPFLITYSFVLNDVNVLYLDDIYTFL